MNYSVKIFSMTTKNGNKYFKFKINNIYLGAEDNIMKCLNSLNEYYEIESIYHERYTEWEDKYIILNFDIDLLEKDKVINKIIDLMPEEFL